MRIAHSHDAHGKTENRSDSANFTGEVWADPILPVNGDGAGVLDVFFMPGGRTYWHSHSAGQCIQVKAGQGVICQAGGTAAQLTAGDIVWAPANELHWHGAGPATAVAHTAVSLGTTNWGEEVSAEEYERAAAEASSD
jgi:quercetin dioxygenase-like cupin family protein